MRKRYNTLYPEQSVTYSQSMEMWAKNADEGQNKLFMRDIRHINIQI